MESASSQEVVLVTSTIGVSKMGPVFYDGQRILNRRRTSKAVFTDGLRQRCEFLAVAQVPSGLYGLMRLPSRIAKAALKLKATRNVLLYSCV